MSFVPQEFTQVLGLYKIIISNVEKGTKQRRSLYNIRYSKLIVENSRSVIWVYLHYKIKQYQALFPALTQVVQPGSIRIIQYFVLDLI